MLTPQQLGFAQARIDGMKQSEAYRANYNCANMSPHAIAVEASKLIKHPEVSLMVSSAIQATVSDLIGIGRYTTEKLVAEAEYNLLQSRLLDQMAPANKALEIIGRVTGVLDAPTGPTEVRITKVTVVLNTGKDTVIDAKYEVLDDETLPSATASDEHDS